MGVVQQVQVVAIGVAQPGEQLRDVVHVFRGRPHLLMRQRLDHAAPILLCALAGAVNRGQAGDADLAADGDMALVALAADGVDGLLDAHALGVGVDHRLLPRGAAQQLVQRHVRRLGLDVPQRHVDGRDRGHGDRPAPPIGALVEILPDVLDLRRVAADQKRRDMVLQVADHRELAPVHRAVADAVQALVGDDLEGDEVPPGRADDDLDVLDLHEITSSGIAVRRPTKPCHLFPIVILGLDPRIQGRPERLFVAPGLPGQARQ